MQRKSLRRIDPQNLWLTFRTIFDVLIGGAGH
jgi:hypothetical protein